MSRVYIFISLEIENNVIRRFRNNVRFKIVGIIKLLADKWKKHTNTRTLNHSCFATQSGVHISYFIDFRPRTLFIRQNFFVSLELILNTSALWVFVFP